MRTGKTYFLCTKFLIPALGYCTDTACSTLCLPLLIVVFVPVGAQYTNMGRILRTGKSQGRVSGGGAAVLALQYYVGLEPQCYDIGAKATPLALSVVYDAVVFLPVAMVSCTMLRKTIQIKAHY